ncbi:hypothetical protein BGX24_004171 [Mortierella sp. AD032]|nr:hypothetical protein BGX24_004171 [Mortierella sp. AD032]
MLLENLTDGHNASERRSSRGLGTSDGNGAAMGTSMEPGYGLQQYYIVQQQQQQQQERQLHVHHHDTSFTTMFQEPPQPLNVGARDIGTVPNSILIVTDLPQMVNESRIWNALTLLGPLVRVMLAKDRHSKISWGYCFAEYSDVQNATLALEKAKSKAFTIQNKPVEIHYAHHGSFIPAYAPTQWTIDYGSEGQLAIYWDEQAFLSAYSQPSAASCASNTPVTKGMSSPTTTKPTGAEKDELSVFYAVMGDVLQSEPSSSRGGSGGAGSSIFAVPTFAGTVATSATAAASSVLPAPSIPPNPVVPPPTVVELPSIPTTAKLDKVQLAGIAAAQAAEQLAKAEEKKKRKANLTQGLGQGQGQQQLQGSSSIGIGGGGKKISIQLQKWSNLQAKGGESSPAPTTSHRMMDQDAPLATSISSSSSSSLQGTLLSPHTSPSPARRQQQQQELVYDPDELLDLKINACLLCQRRLKSVQDLRKHQSLSDLHKKNLLDRAAVEVALVKSRGGVTATAAVVSSGTSSMAGVIAGAAMTAGEEEPKYRDRAAERRQIFGQPDYPLPPVPSSGPHSFGGRGNNNAHGGRGGGGGGGGGYGHQETIIPEQPTKDGIKEDNIGNRLLKSMGWKEGQGLGRDSGTNSGERVCQRCWNWGRGFEE